MDPGQGARATDQDGAQPTTAERVAPSETTPEEPKSSKGWFRNLLNQVQGRPADSAASRAGAEAKADERAKDGEQQPAGSEEQAQPKTVTLTEDELKKHVQAEVDRREALERRRREREQRREAAKDPWKSQEVLQQEVSSEESHERFVQALQPYTAAYDEYIVEPIVHALPDAERQRILKSKDAQAPTIEARRYIVLEALKAIETQATGKAREQLRKDPAFRKELLAELRGDPSVKEPALISGKESSGAPSDMNAILRQAVGKFKS